MTAMTLDALSGGRFILGLGTSGPQVVEGWHGVPFDKPLTWMREYITIVRAIFAREAPLEFSGQRYQIPYRGPGALGLGKPLKSILHGRKDIPILTGSMAPKGQALVGRARRRRPPHLHAPRAVRGHPVEPRRGLRQARPEARLPRAEDFEIAPTVAVIVGERPRRLSRPAQGEPRLYIGRNGREDKNFYGEYVRRVGFEAEAEKIQTLFLAGKRQEAIHAVSDEMVDTFHLVGTPDRDPRPLPGVEGFRR